MKIFKCKKCGKIIEILDEGSPVTICCGEEMQEVITNTTDAAKEKHVPSYEIASDKINVTIGKVSHPMEEKHYIEWIMVEYNNKVEKVSLKPGMEPKATFDYHKKMTIYAYCNLHGLWKKEVE